MITNKREARICNKYRTWQGGCFECPLAKDNELMICKANSHYNRSERRWEPDDDQWRQKEMAKIREEEEET